MLILIPGVPELACRPGLDPRPSRLGLNVHQTSHDRAGAAKGVLTPISHHLVTICDMMGTMRYCVGYEDTERVVDATGFQMGQAGTTVVQAHAVAVDAGHPAETTACGMSYSSVNDSLGWFDPMYAFSLQRCTECEELTQ